MKHHHTTRLNSHATEHTTPQTTRSQATLEFASSDELLRHDAAQTTVPPAVAERLQESIQREAPERRSWWQRLFGG